MASKPIKAAPAVRLQPMTEVTGPPKPQTSVATRIFKNNRTADRAFPMVQQKYPKFMGKTGF